MAFYHVEQQSGLDPQRRLKAKKTSEGMLHLNCQQFCSDATVVLPSRLSQCWNQSEAPPQLDSGWLSILLPTLWAASWEFIYPFLVAIKHWQKMCGLKYTFLFPSCRYPLVRSLTQDVGGTSWTFSSIRRICTHVVSFLTKNTYPQTWSALIHCCWSYHTSSTIFTELETRRISMRFYPCGWGTVTGSGISGIQF